MELISSCSNPTTTPFFTAPSSPSSSRHPYYNVYDDGDNVWPHRLSLAFDRWGLQPDFTLIPDYDDGVGVDHDEEMGYVGDSEFEFGELQGKVSLASANDLFLEGKIRSLLTGAGSSLGAVVPPGDSERVVVSCTTPRLRVCDILVQGEDEEEDGGDGNNSFMPSPRDRMAVSESTGATTTTCSVGYLSSLLPGMSLLRNRHNRNKSWSLKDFLFRSTSEGRGTSKAAMLAKGKSPHETHWRERRGRTMSAHGLHYRENRMVSEETRRTTLPFKPGFFACLGHGGTREVGHASRRARHPNSSTDQIGY